MAQPQKYPQLGPLKGPGTTTSDSIPAMYSKGEVVISAADVKAIGKAFGKNYLSNLVKTASKDAAPKLGAQTAIKDGKLKASDGYNFEDDPKLFEQLQRAKARIPSTHGFGLSDPGAPNIAPIENIDIQDVNPSRLGQDTHAGTRLIPSGKATRPSVSIARPSIPAENITIPDVSQARIDQANKPVFNPTENINVNPAIDANAVNQAKQASARLDTMARPSGIGFKSLNDSANNIKLGVNYPGSGQAVQAKTPTNVSMELMPSNANVVDVDTVRNFAHGMANQATNPKYKEFLGKSFPQPEPNAVDKYIAGYDGMPVVPAIGKAMTDIAGVGTKVAKGAVNALTQPNETYKNLLYGEGNNTPMQNLLGNNPAPNKPSVVKNRQTELSMASTNSSPLAENKSEGAIQDKSLPVMSGSAGFPGSVDEQQSKTQPGFIQSDNGIPYNVAKQSDGTNTINFTNPDGTGTGTLSGLSGKQAGRFHDGKGAAYSGPGLPDVKPAQIGAQQMQQPYLGENNSGVDESNAYLDQMRDIAVNGGPDRFMGLSEMIGAKHRQRAAQDVLNNISQDNQNKRQSALENAKLGVDTLLAKQRMDQDKTQQDFMNRFEVGKTGYQMKRDEKGDQTASAKATQENELAQSRLGIDRAKLNQNEYGALQDPITGEMKQYPKSGKAADDYFNQQIERKKLIDKTPLSAINHLKENPELIDQFIKKYGYRPEGI